jgi:hypothetical protein
MSVPKYTIGSQFYRVTPKGVVLNTIVTTIIPTIKGKPVPREIKIIYPGICEYRYVTQDENDEYHLYNCASLEQYLSIEKWYTTDYDKGLKLYENSYK